ncbi:MAG: hypothetical protein BWK80_52185 [Desulfobacteraceae bacterium IS3]|nr:MAG: hypothetical protein BWK80_52185 [Desulfobacteraceae bacterium IS3]
MGATMAIWTVSSLKKRNHIPKLKAAKSAAAMIILLLLILPVLISDDLFFTFHASGCIKRPGRVLPAGDGMISS